MGREARCVVHYQGKTSAGKLLLETKELLFRGDFRLAIPTAKIKNPTAVGERLELSFDQEKVAFEIGPDAEKWAARILSPPGRLDKLGVKPEHLVILLGDLDADFAREVAVRTGRKPQTKTTADADLIFLNFHDRAQQNDIAGLVQYLKPAGALWLIRPKGGAPVTEMDVLNAGRSAGLTDVKVVSFSDTQSAAKFVIPVAKRPRKA